MSRIRLLPVIFSLLCSLLLLMAGCSTSFSPGVISGAQMAEANRLYESERYTEAIDLYQGLVEAGAKDGRLFYNLGNAHFKAGDLGRAVLNFRRAQRLLPRDGDVAANLELVRGQTIDRIESENEGPLVKLARHLLGWTTLDEAAGVALALWLVWGGLVIGAILRPRWRSLLRRLAGGLAVLVVLWALSIGVRLLDERGKSAAVIVASEVTVHSGPGGDYVTEFTLHAGAEVHVVERRGSWVRIALPGDLQGWAPSEAVIDVLLPGD
jgi:hypothetical protein